MSPSPQSQSAYPRELRVRAVVERFAPAADGAVGSQEAVYLHQLQDAATGRPIKANGVWVEHNPAWQSAAVQPGDTVIFTTPSRCVVEAVKEAAPTADQGSRPRRRITTVLGPSAANVVVVRRPMPERQQEPTAQPAPTPVTLHGPRQRQRKPVLVVAVAALLLGTLGGSAIGWWAASRQDPSRSTIQAP